MNSQDLKEKDAQNYYLKMYNIFQKFIQNDTDIHNYSDSFDWSKANDVHDNSIKEELIERNYEDYNYYINNLLTSSDFSQNFEQTEMYDYYFKYNNKLYTLNISYDLKRYGLNEKHYRKIHGKHIYNKIFYCEIREYHNFIDDNDIRITMSFIYDKKKKKVIEIVDITRYSLPYIENPTSRIMTNYDKLDKILIKSLK